VRIYDTGLKRAARGSLKIQDAKSPPPKSPSGHHRTTLLGYIFATNAYIDNRKKIVKQQYLLHMFSQYGELRPTSGWHCFVSFGALQQISTGFASWLRYCSDVTQGKPTKLCTMIDHLLGWYTISLYTFSRALASWRNFALCKTHFTFKSCVLLYWQCYCTALQQWASAKLRRGTRNGIRELSQRALPIFGWAAITLGIGPHSSDCMEMFIFQTPYHDIIRRKCFQRTYCVKFVRSLPKNNCVAPSPDCMSVGLHILLFLWVFV